MKVYVVGGSGYTGRELLRILERHPKVDDIFVSSTRLKGKRVSDVHPSLESDLVFTEFDVSYANSCDIVFCCVPHTKSMDIVPDITTNVVDLSADFRLKDPNVYERYYGVAHSCPNLIDDAVYGLPEYYRENIKSARLVANPGCYPTAVILACKPLLDNFGVEYLIADAKSGVSGAGTKKEEELQKFVFDGNLKAYKIVGHQHTPEIDQELDFSVLFTPHLVPVNQGLFATIHALTDADSDKVRKVFEEKYEGEPFVRIVDDPDILSVRNTNLCLIGGFKSDGRRLIITSAIDNLIKGASGQAVQNMNIMMGYDETSGLM